jgi:hypothetical protein
MLTSLCQTSLEGAPVRHSYNRQAPASLSFIERAAAVLEKRRSASRPPWYYDSGKVFIILNDSFLAPIHVNFL